MVFANNPCPIQRLIKKEMDRLMKEGYTKESIMKGLERMAAEDRRQRKLYEHMRRVI